MVPHSVVIPIDSPLTSPWSLVYSKIDTFNTVMMVFMMNGVLVPV